MGAPLSNGHDMTEATLAGSSDGAVILQEQLRAVQVGAARHAERATIEALAQDAMRRLAEAYKAGDHKRAAEITREIVRLEVYLSKRGFPI